MLKLNNLFSALITISLLACSSPRKNDSTSPIIITTTGMLADGVRHILPDKYEVKALMGPGVDPHLYKAVQGDLELLTTCDVIVYNGLHLEGKMSDIFNKLKRTKTVINASASLSKEKLRFPHLSKNPDPHIWFDVLLWKDALFGISKELKNKYPLDSIEISKKTDHYFSQLDTLNKYALSQINTIPDKQKLLITAHDAFGYFGDRYNIEVKGLQGISTVSEVGLKEVESLINLIIKRNIKALFIETSVSKKQLQAVIEACNERNHTITTGGILYSDAMGAQDSPEGTYIGMVTHNINTITKSLK